MRSSRPTLLRRIVGLALVAAAGLTAAGLIYGLRSDEDGAPGAVGPTAPAATTRPPVVTGGHPARPLPGAGGGDEGSPSIDDVLEDLDLVNVAFNAPRTMHLNDPVVIQLLLSGGQTIEQLQEELTALGEQEGEQIRASDAMEAQLTGAGFDIAPVTPAIQLVSNEAVTEWKWEVQPTKTGERRLHLALSALIDLDGKDRTYTVRTFERTLDVNVTFGERLETFASDNWQWLWTALLIPIVGLVLRWRQQRKLPPTDSTPPDAAARPSPH
jgi:hypothetical protein